MPFSLFTSNYYLFIKKGLLPAIAALALLSSCSTQKQLQKTAANTHMQERFSNSMPAPGGVKVLIEENGMARVPPMAQIRRTRLLVLPLLFYFQIRKEFDIRLGKDNLRFFTSNLQLALESAITRQGGLPNCPDCELAVRLDTLKTNVNYLENQISFFAFITTVSIYDIHMGPAPMDVSVTYSLYKGDSALYTGTGSIRKMAPLLRPNDFNAPGPFANRYLEYYFNILDQELDHMADRMVHPLAEKWGKF